MFCIHCGKEIIGNDMFCTFCGGKLINETNEVKIYDNTIKKDIPSKYLYFLLIAYVLVTLSNKMYLGIAYCIGYSLGMFLWVLPIIGIVYLIQKIRKKPYLRPKLHIAIISFLFFLTSVFDK